MPDIFVEQLKNNTNPLQCLAECSISMKVLENLNALSAQDKKRLVDKILKLSTFQLETFLIVISKLAYVCYESCGPIFIREGNADFLGALLQAFIEKLNGEDLRKTFAQGKEALRHFQFTPEVQSVFGLLQEIAKTKANNPGQLEPGLTAQDYVGLLPQSIANKIMSPLLAINDPNAQNMTSTSDIMQTLFNYNVDAENIQPYVGLLSNN